MSNLFDKLTNDEKKLLDRYECLLKRGILKRSANETILDKLQLLSSARLLINSTRKERKIDDGYIENTIDKIKKHPTDYSITFNLNKLINQLYESKKFANYDRTTEGLFTTNDRHRQLTPDGIKFSNYLTKNSNNDSIDIINKLDSGWIYRVPNGSDKNKIDHRYAINAKPNINLIALLDTYTKKHNMYYKTCKPGNWHDRIDSIVIYCSSPQTQEEIQELKQITRPYIRKNLPLRVNDMDGQLISDGIITAKEVNIDMCKKLHSDLNKIYPPLAQLLQDKLDESPNKLNPLSLGQYCNYQNIVDTFNAIKSNPNSKVKPSYTQDNQIYNIKLSQASRLSFAPDIEELQISKGKNDELRITGNSKDGKQHLDFTHLKGKINFTLTTKDFSYSYTNKDGSWIRKDLKSPTGTRYFDETGASYTKELALIMNKIKEKRQSRSQQNHTQNMLTNKKTLSR